MTTARRQVPLRLLRSLACALGLSGMALACPPAPAPFVPFDGEPFRFRADLTDVAACSVAWFTLDESGIRSLDIDSSLDDWLMLDHPSSFPLFLEPEQVVGPTVFDEIAANRVTLDGRSFVVAFGFRFDRVYNEAIFMRLAFELPARPSAVVPPAPAAAPEPPEPTYAEVRRERWGAFEVVGESAFDAHDDHPGAWLGRVRILDANGETRWEPGDIFRIDFEVSDVFGDGTPVLSVRWHTGGDVCCDVAHHFVQREGELVMIAGRWDELRDYDDDGVPERWSSAALRVSGAVYIWFPVLQIWDSATTSFGPVVTRERFAPTLANSLATHRQELLTVLMMGWDPVTFAAQVYAVAYYLDPHSVAAERDRMRRDLPALAYEQLEASFAAIEEAVDAFAAEAATWQPQGLGDD